MNLMDAEIIDCIKSEFDVVSFDVFDTLLVRRCLEPCDVFAMVEKKTSCRGYAKARS